MMTKLGVVAVLGAALTTAYSAPAAAWGWHGRAGGYVAPYASGYRAPYVSGYRAPYVAPYAYGVAASPYVDYAYQAPYAAPYRYAPVIQRPVYGWGHGYGWGHHHGRRW